ncbi:MAG: hypothetical protein AAF804_06560, partial [Bacteroidota bacterium]
MERIRSVFASLSRVELRLLKNYLTGFHKKGDNKALEIIHYLEDCPSISHGDMAELLYSNHKAKGLSMLKPKLLERMLETLNLSINPDHTALA